MEQGHPLVVNLDRARLFRWLFVGLAVTQVLLVLLDAVITEFGAVEIGAARRLFNITREDSMPNFFSSMLLLANGGVLLGVTLAVRARSGDVAGPGVWEGGWSSAGPSSPPSSCSWAWTTPPSCTSGWAPYFRGW